MKALLLAIPLLLAGGQISSASLYPPQVKKSYHHANCARIPIPSMQPNLPQHSSAKDSISTEAIEVVRQLLEAMIRRDLPTMERLLAPEFTLTHITGYRQPRAEWLEEVRSESMKYYSSREERIHAEQTGGGDSPLRVVVRTRNLLDARIWGSRNNWRLQQMMTLEWRNGQPQILSSVATLY